MFFWFLFGFCTFPKQRGYALQAATDVSSSHGSGCKVAQVNNLHTVLLLELKVLLVQGVDTVNHDLDKLNLGVTQTVLVGNIVGATSLATRFTSGASGLDGQLLASSLQLVNALLGVAGEVNVHRGAHTSS